MRFEFVHLIYGRSDRPDCPLIFLRLLIIDARALFFLVDVLASVEEEEEEGVKCRLQ